MKSFNNRVHHIGISSSVCDDTGDAGYLCVSVIFVFSVYLGDLALGFVSHSDRQS